MESSVRFLRHLEHKGNETGRLYSFALLALVALFATQIAFAAEPDFVFHDATKEAGLLPDIAGIAGHGAGWGDVDGDGWPDLYVGTFAAKPYGSKDNLFFRNQDGRFTLDKQKPLQVRGRANGEYFIDLDNDGYLDIFATNHAIQGEPNKPDTSHYSTPCKLFHNDGKANFTDVSEGSGICQPLIAARSLTVLDYDGDRKLDLLVAEDCFQGGKSRTRLYRNLGKMKFKDVTSEVGIPNGVTGFGVAAGDLNGDGWPDLFINGREGGSRCFINDGRGHFRPLPGANGSFKYVYTESDDTACGVAFGDVNRDGQVDILLGSHYSRPWFTGGVSLRLYLNRGNRDGFPVFEEVTKQVGMLPLFLKSPHVEVQDFDNDGWPDLYTSIVKFDKGGRPHPFIFRNLGIRDGLPRFRCDALAVNNFPTADDKKIAGSDEFFNKVIADHKIIYMSTGPTCDYDHDGRLDMILPNWWVNDQSLLLHNDTKGGNWLQIAVEAKGFPMGVGCVIRIYEPGKLGDRKGLIGDQEIGIAYGNASGHEAIAHFGLGDLTKCDLQLTLPRGKAKMDRKDVEANQRLKLVYEPPPTPEPAVTKAPPPAPVQ